MFLKKTILPLAVVSFCSLGMLISPDAKAAKFTAKIGHLESAKQPRHQTLEIVADLVKKSISKIQYRVLDQLKCQPLQAEVILVNNELTVPLGSSQGLKKGTVGFISSSRDVIMSEWIVLTVRDTNENTSILEPLNPQNKNNQIQGKTIKFIN